MIAKSKCLTYAQIAEKSGVKESTIKAFMCGTTDSRRVAENIADVLGVEIVYSNGKYKINSNKTEKEGEPMTNNIELRGCDSAMTRQVIVTKALKGSGKENDPYREVTQYWSLTGKLLFELLDKFCLLSNGVIFFSNGIIFFGKSMIFFLNFLS